MLPEIEPKEVLVPLNDGPLDGVREQNLQDLVDHQVTEKSTLEYKRDLPGHTHTDRKEFLRDVASFANTAGGHIVYGIREDAGRPMEAIGMAVADPDAEIARLENLLRDGIRPRISGIGVAAVSLSNGSHAILIRIPTSWAKPHMVTFQDDGKFYARNSNGKYSMDVDQLRTAFVLGSAINQRSRDLRAERISAILEQALPISIGGDCLHVLHVLPYSAFTDGGFVDISAVDRDDTVVRLFPGNDNRLKFGLEGVHFYPANASSRCLTIFRDGSVELLEPTPVNRSNAAIFELELERNIIDCFADAKAVQRRLGVNPPFAVFLSFLNVQGQNLNITEVRNPWNNGHAIEQEPLLISGTRADNFDTDGTRSLRPVFDGLWLPAGWPRSMNYNDAGAHVGWINA
jgi:hypothetical protein